MVVGTVRFCHPRMFSPWLDAMPRAVHRAGDAMSSSDDTALLASLVTGLGKLSGQLLSSAKNPRDDADDSAPFLHWAIFRRGFWGSARAVQLLRSSPSRRGCRKPALVERGEISAWLGREGDSSRHQLSWAHQFRRRLLRRPPVSWCLCRCLC